MSDKFTVTRLLAGLGCISASIVAGEAVPSTSSTSVHRNNEHEASKNEERTIPLQQDGAGAGAGRRQQTTKQQQRRLRPTGKVQRMTKEQIAYAEEKSPEAFSSLSEEERRKLSDSSSSSGSSFFPTFDNGAEVDSWSQGYRLLGGYIDCDHNRNDEYGNEGSGDHNGEQNRNQQQHRNLKSGNNNDTGYGCSRWSMWAAYYNPNYTGNGYYEYFGSEYPSSTLDCHKSDTEWQLIGVYREELYQWYEQISKHLWAIDEYDYVVALAGLAFMTDADCQQVGNDSYGNAIYAGVQPQSEGNIQMALYSDPYCITLSDSGKTYSDFVGTSNMKLSSKDNGGNYYDLYDYWVDSQEYTLYNFNQVYDNFKTCTPCMDYPTYQDGFFIGDTGTDDDDLINQCWKFYSHDSYTCNGDCVALGSAQGTILEVQYNGYSFGYGTPSDNGDYYSSSSSSGSDSSATTSTAKAEVPYFQSEKFATLKANFFIGLASVLFLGTFLAFAVARGSARALEKEDKAHVLLDDYYQDPYADRKKRRRDRDGKSRSGRSSGRSPGKSRSSRSTSRHRSDASKSRSGRSLNRTSSGRSLNSEDSEARRQRRRERRRERERRYEAPTSDGKSSSSSRRSKSRSSRRVRDDF